MSSMHFVYHRGVVFGDTDQCLDCGVETSKVVRHSNETQEDSAPSDITQSCRYRFRAKVLTPDKTKKGVGKKWIAQSIIPFRRS